MNSDVAKGKIKPAYAILGSGSVGFSVAKSLVDQGKDVVIVDRDEKRVENLRDQNFEAIVGDISEPGLIKELEVDDLEAVIVLSSDMDANKRALELVKEKAPDVHTVARAADPISAEELDAAGADMVLVPPKVVANAAVRYIERVESVRHAKELSARIEEVAGQGKLAIVVHPDPDAISSALALGTIAKTVDVEADVIYYGDIGHQANRALVNLLEIDLKRIDEVNWSEDEYASVAMVDTTPLAVEADIGPSVDIVIDHHPVDDREAIHASFIDLRTNVGAAATIMTKYLQELDIAIDQRLATALLYGIRTDTQGFKRNTHSADLTAAAFLYPLADHELLGKIESPSMSAETLTVLGEAIRNRKIQGSYLISNVGFIRDRDALPQAAEYLLNLEGVTTVIVFGLTEDNIHLSGRSKDIRLNLGASIHESFGDIGSAGGHANMAAAKIPLGVFSGIKDKQTLLKLAEEAVMKRFLSVVGVEEAGE